MTTLRVHLSQLQKVSSSHPHVYKSRWVYYAFQQRRLFEASIDWRAIVYLLHHKWQRQNRPVLAAIAIETLARATIRTPMCF